MESNPDPSRSKFFQTMVKGEMGILKRMDFDDACDPVDQIHDYHWASNPALISSPVDNSEFLCGPCYLLEIQERDKHIQYLIQRVAMLEDMVNQYQQPKESKDVDVAVQFDSSTNIPAVGRMTVNLEPVDTESPHGNNANIKQSSGMKNPAKDAILDNNSSIVEKVTQLFPEVLNVYWTKFANSREDSRELLNLNCRLVCKSWRDEVDKILYLEDSPFRFQKRIFIKINKGEGFDTVSKRLRIYYDLPRCPFPSRYLRVSEYECYKNESKYEKVKNAVTGLLVKVGKCVHTFYYDARMLNTRSYSPVPWYNTFRKWIMLMPNLKELHVSSSSWRYDNYTWHSESPFAKQLDMAVRSHPFPMLGSLESFTVMHIPNSIVQSALAANSQITYFKAKDFGFKPLLLPSLQEIQLEVFDGCVYPVQDLDNLFAPLVTLKLKLCSNYHEGGKDGLHAIVTGTQRFDATLRTLEFDFSLKFGYLHVLARLQLQLPNLRKLKVNFRNGKFYDQNCQSGLCGCIIELVSQLNSLQELSILHVLADNFFWFKFKQPTRSYWRMELNTHLVSKLWDLLPCLQILEISLTSKKYFRKIREDTYSHQLFYFTRDTYN